MDEETMKEFIKDEVNMENVENVENLWMRQMKEPIYDKGLQF